MDSFKPRRTRREGPESIIQKAIIKLLESKGWIVKSTHGNEFQSGFPDLYTVIE